MPTYEHQCTECGIEFEAYYEITEPIPVSCPACGKENCIKRLISGGSGRMIVKLSGHDLVNYHASASKKLKQDILNPKNENTLANIIGEDKYNKSVK